MRALVDGAARVVESQKRRCEMPELTEILVVWSSARYTAP